MGLRSPATRCALRLRSLRALRPRRAALAPDRAGSPAEVRAMGRRAAAIAGIAEWKPLRVWDRPMFMLEACAELAALALADAGIEKGEVDGLLVPPLSDSPMFGPSAAAEYLGVPANFGEVVDLGGASGAGMGWRAAAPIERGVCGTCPVLCPTVP